MEPSLDVTSLYNRRAVNRWERTSVGDLTERVTWSYPDKEAVIGAQGAYADPRFARALPSPPSTHRGYAAADRSPGRSAQASSRDPTRPMVVTDTAVPTRNDSERPTECLSHDHEEFIALSRY
jgi:hypothetical protein